MKKIEYKKIADVMQECIEHAMHMQVKLENPEGKKEVFQLSDISLSLLTYQNRSIIIYDGISNSNDVVSLNKVAELKMKIWIRNDVKVVRMDFSYTNLIPEPNYIKMFFMRVIHSAIEQSVNGFFSQKICDNKYSEFTRNYGIEDCVEPDILENFSEDGIAKLEKLTRDIYKKKNILSASVEATINRKLWIVCNNLGTKIIQNQDSAIIVIDFEYLSPQKKLSNDSFVDYFKTFEELEAEIDNIKIKLEKKFCKMETIRIGSGIYPILLKPSAVATLFHEAIAGHMFSAKYILNGSSTVFEKKLGKRFANSNDIPILDLLSIYDNPLEENMMAYYKYDMEGSTAQNVCLLDKGIVKNYLTDKNTAYRLKKNSVSNGHHLADSFTEIYNNKLVSVIPEPRISNLIVESHSDISLEEMKDAILSKHEYYIEIDSRRGAVSIETGTFDLIVDSATKVYRDGRREAVYKGVLSSNLTDFLAAIEIVSNHYGESKGICGSDSGYVPTHGKAPAMFLYGINFVSDPKQEKFTEINIKRDKFIPDDF